MGSGGSPVRFPVVRKLLESKGWTLVRMSSSHAIFQKPGALRPEVVPVHHNLVDHAYYRKAQKLP